MHLQRAAQAAYAHEKLYRSPDSKRFVANTTDRSIFRLAVLSAGTGNFGKAHRASQQRSARTGVRKNSTSQRFTASSAHWGAS